MSHEKMKMIYVASPYTIGDTFGNVIESIAAGSKLISKGFCPVLPLLSHFHDIQYPEDYETWMKIDIEKLSRCDALLRLPGESSGADREVKFAEENGIPVYYNIGDVK